MKPWIWYLGIGILLVGGTAGSYWFLSQDTEPVSLHDRMAPNAH